MSAHSVDMPTKHGEGSAARISDFFNVERWSALTGVRIIELAEAKVRYNSDSQPESLACWGRQWWQQPLLEAYNITMNAWSFPPSLVRGRYTSFREVGMLESTDQSDWLQKIAIEQYGSVKAAPSFPADRLLCLHDTYFIQDSTYEDGVAQTSAYSIEELDPTSALWLRVGQHLHFNANVDEVADAFLRAMAQPRNGRYVGVHLRQGDFIRGNKALNGSRELLEIYAKGVLEVQAGLQKQGLAPRDLPVLFATDSNDVNFLSMLVDNGWTYVSPEATETAGFLGAHRCLYS
jgi:hypothetical protein